MRVPVLPGDTVRIVAPAGRGSPANLSSIKAYVESLGLVAQISDNIYGDSPFYSNTDEFRAQDLIAAIRDPLCKIIWCIRGGSGCIRLVPFLDKEFSSSPPAEPKLLIGYSDITALHLYVSKNFRWPTMHGPMLEGIVNGQYDPTGQSVTLLKDLIFDRINEVFEPTMTRLDSRDPIGTISTEVIGGNLTLVETSVATGWEINGTGKIIFLEDVGEAAYSMERSLDHMKQAGVFASAAAVVFGDFTDPDSAALMELALQRFADDEEYVTCPVFSLKGIGHSSTNIPLPFGTLAEIKVNDEGSKLYTMSVTNT
jgi:muramoyltetrapeptide carboxypeptidase